MENSVSFIGLNIVDCSSRKRIFFFIRILCLVFTLSFLFSLLSCEINVDVTNSSSSSSSGSDSGSGGGSNGSDSGSGGGTSDSSTSETGTAMDIEKIISAGAIPSNSDIDTYDEHTRLIFEDRFGYNRYDENASVAVKYLNPISKGLGDASSWDNASDNLRDVLADIKTQGDASANKIYVILMATGTYAVPATIDNLQNYVAIVGGMVYGTYNRASVNRTILDANSERRIIYSYPAVVTGAQILDYTTVLYGLNIEHGTESNNFTGEGGGLYIKGSSPDFIDIVFRNNRAGASGGAISLSDSESSFYRVHFEDNEATGDGGGGGAISISNSSVIIRNASFVRNTATGTNTDGGAVRLLSTSITFISTTFYENETKNGGGAVSVSTATPIDPNAFYRSITFINSTFANNKAGIFGGAISISGDYDDNIQIYNSILWGNSVNGNDTEISISNVDLTSSGVRESLIFYNSIIKQGLGTLSDGSALNSGVATKKIIGGGISTYEDTSSFQIASSDIYLFFQNIFSDDPGLGALEKDSNSEVYFLPISSSSSAVDRGMYIRGEELGDAEAPIDFYYSLDDISWYDDSKAASGLTDQVSAYFLTDSTEDLVDTDIRNSARKNARDIGAYESQ